MQIVILAGGGGTRLWPLSKQNFPKQFLKFLGEESLLQQTVGRFAFSGNTDGILVATNKIYKPLVLQQLMKVKGCNQVDVMTEPLKKNTAPAIALAIRYLEIFRQAQSEDIVSVLPSDHLIEPKEIFLDYLKKAEETARSGKIILFGIYPSNPNTGFGYLKIGMPFDSVSYTVEKFIEKPSLERAEQLLNDPLVFWNSGIFVFSIQTIWAAFEKHLPNIAQMRHWNWSECQERFHEMEDLSIDYGLMEKATNVVACPLPVSWSDVGSWDSVYEVLKKDENQNVKIGNIIDLETKNCLIIGGKKIISTIGLEDLLIVETDQAIFISKKGASQKIKELLSKLPE
jgi:mannose-1-phosphate guanylyltransferase/mannose-6-phosphate isomerase